LVKRNKRRSGKRQKKAATGVTEISTESNQRGMIDGNIHLVA